MSVVTRLGMYLLLFLVVMFGLFFWILFGCVKVEPLLLQQEVLQVQFPNDFAPTHILLVQYTVAAVVKRIFQLAERDTLRTVPVW